MGESQSISAATPATMAAATEVPLQVLPMWAEVINLLNVRPKVVLWEELRMTIRRPNYSEWE